MSRHRAGHEQRPLLWAGPLVVMLALLVGLLVALDPGSDSGQAQLNVSATDTSDSEPKPNPAVDQLPAPAIQSGKVIRPDAQSRLEALLVKASTGRVGSGLTLGPIAELTAPLGRPVKGAVTSAVANLPNRTSAGGFASSMGTLTADQPDFLMLNEVSGRSIDGIRATSPGYDAYRDPQPDGSTGGVQSMNNVVMWRPDRWTLVDGGRIKVVDNDTGIHAGRTFVWDRYATWAVFQRKDGAIVSILSTHMPTNPAKFPRQPAGATMTRVERYSRGMDVLVNSIRTLAAHGPVLLGGDMNSHHSQGAWTAAAKMTAAGYEYVKDQGVMHLFFPGAAEVAAHRQVGVASDHPAIITTLDMNGLGPTR
jgi:endonuclease/exonuclease/phosphatase family metal-dependent hydrolase